MTPAQIVDLSRALRANIDPTHALPSNGFLVDIGDGGRVCAVRADTDGSVLLTVDGEDVPGRFEIHIAVSHRTPFGATKTVPATWGQVCAGDQIRTKTNEWVPVTGAYAGMGVNAGKAIITVDLNGKLIEVKKDAAESVADGVRRGKPGRAADAFRAAGVDVEVISS